MVLVENLTRGIKWGLYFAFCYSIIVALLALFRGNAPFENASTTLPMVLGVYWVCGLIVGALIGALWPLGKSYWGAALLGAIGSLPVSLAILMATEPRSAWREELVLYVGIGLIAGPLFGLSMKLRP